MFKCLSFEQSASGYNASYHLHYELPIEKFTSNLATDLTQVESSCFLTPGFFHRHRNTSHFHCLQPGCTYSVVGLSGIEQHYNKHKRGILLAQVCNKTGYVTDDVIEHDVSSQFFNACISFAGKILSTTTVWLWCEIR